MNLAVSTLPPPSIMDLPLSYIQTSENSELSEWWERQTELFSHHGGFM